MSTPEVVPTEVEDLSLDLVREATSPLGKYLANGGVKYATKTVNIYTDLEAQLEINELLPEIEARRGVLEREALDSIVGDEEDTDAELGAMKLQLAELQKRKFETRLELTLQTVPGKVMQAITRSMDAKQKTYKWTLERRNEIYMKHFWAQSIKSVKIIETGEVINGPLSLDDYDDFMETLPETQVVKLFETAEMLTRALEMADDKIDAGFPGRVPDLARKL